MFKKEKDFFFQIIKGQMEGAGVIFVGYQTVPNCKEFSAASQGICGCGAVTSREQDPGPQPRAQLQH